MTTPYGPPLIADWATRELIKVDCPLAFLWPRMLEIVGRYPHSATPRTIATFNTIVASRRKQRRT